MAQKLPKMAQKLAPAKKNNDISPVSPTFCISTICKGLKLHQQIRIINNFTQVKQTSQSFILQNNPLGFSNRRRLDRATDKFVHHGNVTLCLSQN